MNHDYWSLWVNDRCNRFNAEVNAAEEAGWKTIVVRYCDLLQGNVSNELSWVEKELRRNFLSGRYVKD